MVARCPLRDVIHWGYTRFLPESIMGKKLGIGEWIMNTAKIPVSEYEKFGKAV